MVFGLWRKCFIDRGKTSEYVYPQRRPRINFDIYHQIMGRDGKIPLDLAREFLTHERLPETWTPNNPSRDRWELMKTLTKLRWKMLTLPTTDRERDEL